MAASADRISRTSRAMKPQGVSLTAQQVQAFLHERIAGYKLPKRIVLVESLPKNPSGKLLKRELRRRYAPPSS